MRFLGVGLLSLNLFYITTGYQIQLETDNETLYETERAERDAARSVGKLIILYI